MNFLPLTSILLAGLLINAGIRRANRIDDEKKRQYLAREKKASRTPSKNLDKIPWITVPSDLPLNILQNDNRCRKLQEIIKKISAKKIADFSAYSSTDLKLEYGASNINMLTEADSNCIMLLRSLNELSEIYFKNDFCKEAVSLLQFAVDCGSDDPEHFEKLSSYYMEHDDLPALTALLRIAEELDSGRSERILKELKRTALIVEAVGYEQTSEGNT